MNQMFTAPSQAHLLLRKAEIYSLLDQICQALELTAAQLEAARTSYEAVAEWLSESDNPLLKWIDIYAQLDRPWYDGQTDWARGLRRRSHLQGVALYR
jgi:hypothetical protein